MQYLCLIYIEEKKLDAMPKSEMDALMDETLAYNEMLQKSGHLISTAGLKPVQTATTIRMRMGKLSITDGPFAETKEVLGGFYAIEARDLNEVIQLASSHRPSTSGASRCGRSTSSSSRSREAQIRRSARVIESPSVTHLRFRIVK